MAGKKSQIIARIGGYSEQCRRSIEEIGVRLRDVPSVPREGGQRYYVAQQEFMQGNVVPLLEQLDAEKELLQKAILELEKYVRQASKNLLKAKAAKKAAEFLQDGRQLCTDIAAAVRDTVRLVTAYIALTDDNRALLARLSDD